MLLTENPVSHHDCEACPIRHRAVCARCDSDELELLEGIKTLSVMELAELVKTMAESDSEIVTIPYDEAYESGFEDMPRRVPDLTKVKELVGYEPRVDLPEILSKVIEHHRTRSE